MTTYTKTGFTLEFDATGAVTRLEGARELALFLPEGGNSRFSYSLPEQSARDLPLAQISGDGRLLLALEGGGLPAAHGLFFSTLTWDDAGETRSTILMGLDMAAGHNGAGILTERALFAFAGAPLPPLATLADWQGFVAQITAWDPVESGRYGPGALISWGVIFEAVSADDLAVGTDGTNAIETGAGDDLILPGNNDGYDFIATGAGEDEIRFTGVTRGFYDLYFRDLDSGIRADIHARDNRGLVDKGAAGQTTLVDVQAAFEAGGIYLYGTDQGDHLKVVPGFGAFVGLRGDGGDDVFVIGKGAADVRLSFASAETGVTVNLTRGRVVDDGLGGQDKIRGKGHVDEVLAGMGNDRVIGSDHAERFFLQAGRDFLDGRGGFDHLRYDHTGAEALRADLAKGRAKGTWEGESFVHRIQNIEALSGSLEGDDRLLGDGGRNHLFGLGGNDLLKGRKGRDRLDGGAGDDLMVGGAGADVFVFSDGADLVRDFRTGQDRLDLRHSGLGGTTWEDLTAGRWGQISQSGADVLLADEQGNQMRLLDCDLDLMTAENFIF